MKWTGVGLLGTQQPATEMWTSTQSVLLLVNQTEKFSQHERLVRDEPDLSTTTCQQLLPFTPKPKADTGFHFKMRKPIECRVQMLTGLSSQSEAVPKIQ